MFREARILLGIQVGPNGQLAKGKHAKRNLTAHLPAAIVVHRPLDASEVGLRLVLLLELGNREHEVAAQFFLQGAVFGQILAVMLNGIPVGAGLLIDLAPDEGDRKREERREERASAGPSPRCRRTPEIRR